MSTYLDACAAVLDVLRSGLAHTLWCLGAWCKRWPALQPETWSGFRLHPMIAAATQEVVTAVKLKLHMTVLVLNDNAYGVRARGAALRGGALCVTAAALRAC